MIEQSVKNVRASIVIGSVFCGLQLQSCCNSLICSAVSAWHAFSIFSKCKRGLSVIMVSEGRWRILRITTTLRPNLCFSRLTVQPFNHAGFDVSSVKVVVAPGVYFTTAVKCWDSSGAFH